MPNLKYIDAVLSKSDCTIPGLNFREDSNGIKIFGIWNFFGVLSGQFQWIKTRIFEKFWMKKVLSGRFQENYPWHFLFLSSRSIRWYNKKGYLVVGGWVQFKLDGVGRRSMTHMMLKILVKKVSAYFSIFKAILKFFCDTIPGLLLSEESIAVNKFRIWRVYGGGKGDFFWGIFGKIKKVLYDLGGLKGFHKFFE